ncbi:MAG: Dihydrolipoamide dehydrogenase of branched-chain alpha-keto acid dehydrogenase / Dihydrolipoamide dehydrogenase [uncultured Rubrobacteraceae bacterium]|uniref:Dihydrolipoamide dehydrogenase of branched-chain alpha-keto acid dehydrogenase / Dihydrolipoamide dehydrogenase n=1 Tax=uncultured Rubrobacteraceae bacterium TaxID=349277 RepID=A0A6J4R0I4_9ACTN|nr:MAG: Dihydrolipoamide dehydrogenase of branched-chain alpha-keto acid dehydrogenase / Dihydrolipoamide dehydrogenase [uncultured Rubrobacteraceae bacterium]
MADNFDLVVIGGGNGGYIPAIRASQLGMKVALIEKRESGYLGGTCLNVGCIPTKALLHTAHLLHNAKTGEEFGVKVSDVEFDYPTAAKRREQVVNQLRRGVQGLMKKNKITVYNGVGSFVEPKKIKVEGNDGETHELEAGNVLISTGSAVSTLPGLEFDGERVISSDDIVTNDEYYPKSVIILGSGAVGVEFASMYNDFGTDVTVVELLDRIVPLEDPEISEVLKKEFEGRGIRVLTSTKADPESLEKTDDGVRIKVASAGSGEQEETEGEGGSYGGEDAPTGEAGEGDTLEAEALVVAVGRRTVTEDLNLDVTNVEVNDRGEIKVDGFGQTAEDGVYAAGDVVGGYWLAHAAGHEGIIAVEHMAGEDPMPMNQDLVPRVTFCRPEVASFGLSKAQAEEQGYEVKESKFPFRAIGKALIEGEPNGFFKVVADAETSLILGMHAIGPKVTDLIAEGVFAKLVEGTPEEIGMSIHAHPSLAEVVAEASMAVDGHAIHF